MSEITPTTIKQTKKCPYCGEIVELNVQKCKHCGEWLSKPQKISNIKHMPTFLFLVLQVVTLGMYPIVWLWMNFKHLDNITTQKTNKFLLVIVTILGLLTALTSYLMMTKAVNSSTNSFNVLYWIIQIPITMSILKQLELYAQEKYNKTIKHNGFMAIICTILYVNFALNTFVERVTKAQG